MWLVTASQPHCDEQHPIFFATRCTRAWSSGSSTTSRRYLRIQRLYWAHFAFGPMGLSLPETDLIDFPSEVDGALGFTSVLPKSRMSVLKSSTPTRHWGRDHSMSETSNPRARRSDKTFGERPKLLNGFSLRTKGSAFKTLWAINDKVAFKNLLRISPSSTRAFTISILWKSAEPLPMTL